MSLSPQDQAILLINASLPKSDAQSAKPLSRSEWARFSLWLRERQLGPADLLNGNPNALLSGLRDNTINVDRISLLLKRGATLGLALEKWGRAGLWVITRSSPDYPDRLKKQLKLESPAILFGCGNRNLLNKGGLGVIGSRNASNADLDFTQTLGTTAANEGHSIVSGGARGIDRTAMVAAMDAEGTAIGVVADSLLRAATSATYRKKLMSGELVLVSPFNPEAGFNVGNAMARNRYIYCLSDAAVVICSTESRGGTWSGAVENLRASWVPLWIKQTDDSKSGNMALSKKGAQWLPDNFSIGMLASPQESSKDNRSINKSVKDVKKRTDFQSKPPLINIDEKNTVDHPKDTRVNIIPIKQTNELYIETFEVFLKTVGELTKESPISSAELRAKLKIKSNVIHAWLKRGVNEGFIEKSNKPVRFQLRANSAEQPSLF
jgi:predicted Rossmann fold nucleotide-binding protein DprA/Smf involved in DNA uptake